MGKKLQLSRKEINLTKGLLAEKNVIFCGQEHYVNSVFEQVFFLMIF